MRSMLILNFSMLLKCRMIGFDVSVICARAGAKGVSGGGEGGSSNS